MRDVVLVVLAVAAPTYFVLALRRGTTAEVAVAFFAWGIAWTMLVVP